MVIYFCNPGGVAVNPANARCFANCESQNHEAGFGVAWPAVPLGARCLQLLLLHH